MKYVSAFLSGVGLSVLVTIAVFGTKDREGVATHARAVGRRGRERAQRVAQRGRELVRRGQRFAEGLRQQGLDLNSASQAQIESLGLDGFLAERIVENRPYRTPLDLVSRMIVPEDVYAQIKNRVMVSRPEEAVKVAS